MASFNSTTLVGRLTKDPELKTTNSGKSVCPFTIAVDKGYGREGTNFIDCESWNKTAEYIGKYLKKGSLALVDGRLDQQVWEQNGQKRSKIVVVVNSIESLDNRGTGKMTQTEAIQEAKAYEQEVNNSYGQEIQMSEVPF